MRRIVPRHGRVFVAWATVTALALTGAGSPVKSKKRPETPPKVEETVSNLAYIANGQDIQLEGVGLVTGLEKTGMDPPPSYYREKLLDEMRKAGVEAPNKLLADPHVSMVLVHARVPTGTTTADRLDVEIEVPPAAGTTSLAGGYLVQTRLREVLRGADKVHEGRDLALAGGPVMIGTEKRPNDPKYGRVLGGARVLKGIPYNLILKEGRRSGRNAATLEKVVNQRFHENGGVKQEGAAHAKTDQYLVLTVPRVYHHNPGRYFEVVRRLPVVDNPILRAARQEIWGKQLLDASTAGVAAFSLEGLGPSAAEALKGGLTSPHPQVRFFAAEALAYLNDPSGVEVLGDTVEKWAEFRSYALAALAALDQPASHMRLRRLMDCPDIPVRYGAFNALRTLDENDAALGRVGVMDAPPPDPNEEDMEPMAIALSRVRKRRAIEDPFKLYLVDCDGPPLLHVTQARRCEIVIFGRGQKLLTPIVLGTGPILVNAATDDDKLTISKIMPTQFGPKEQKVNSSLDLGDVLRRLANLGATYPEIVTILADASARKNLPGPLVADAVPPEHAVYVQAALGKDATKKDSAVSKTKLEEEKKKAKRGSLLERLGLKKR